MLRLCLQHPPRSLVLGYIPALGEVGTLVPDLLPVFLTAPGRRPRRPRPADASPAWSVCTVGIDLGVLRCGATLSLTAPDVVTRRELYLNGNQLTSIFGTTWPAEVRMIVYQCMSTVRTHVSSGLSSALSTPQVENSAWIRM